MDRVRIADSIALRRLLARLTDKEISVLLALWGVKLLPTPTKSRSRSERIGYLIQTSFPEGLTLRQIAEIQVRAIHQEGVAQRWVALSASGTSTPRVFLRADELETELTRHLNSFYKHHTSVFRHDDSLWVRVMIFDGTLGDKLPHRTNTMTLIYFPHHSRLLCSPLKKEHTPYIHQALCMALGAEKITEEPLQGSNATSLAELLLNPHAQGPMMRYKRGKVDNNPLDPSPAPKKPKTKPPPIARVDAEKITQRANEMEEAFGSEPQAGFEQLTFEIRGPWRGQALARPITDTFPVKIRFEGPNVVEGLRELTRAGVLETPVPAYLANVHSLARNSFVVRDMNSITEGDETEREEAVRQEKAADGSQ